MGLKRRNQTLDGQRARTLKTILYNVFFDAKGIVMLILTPVGQSATGKLLHYICVTKSLETLQRATNEDGELLHYNAPEDTCKVTVGYLKKQHINILPDPPYSPYLAPCDFYLFPKLKGHMSRK